MEELTREEIHCAELCVASDPHMSIYEQEILSDAVTKLLANYRESLAAAAPRVERSEPGGYDAPAPEKLRKKS